MSTEPPLTDDEISAVAEQLKEHSGVYTRRDIIAAAAATGSLGVLGALGIDEAEASHGTGRAGEPGDPLEAVYANKIGDASEPAESAHTDSLEITSDLSNVSVPTDFDTVKNALQLSKVVRPNQEYTITIESGHTITDASTVQRGDYSYVTITTNGNTINVGGSFPSTSSVFQFQNCLAPEFKNCSFDFGSNGKNGINFGHSQGGEVRNSTLKNAGENNIEVNFSQAELEDINLSGAANQNLRVTQGAYVHIGDKNGGGTIQNAGGINVFCSRNSNLYAYNHDLVGATDDNLNVARSRAVWEDGNITNAGKNGVLARSGSSVAIISDSITADITATQEAVNANASTVYVVKSALGASSNDCVIANRARVELFGATFNNVGTSDIIVNAQDSDVNLRSSTVDASINDRDWIAVRGGSFVRAVGMQDSNATGIADSNVNGATLNTVDKDGIVLG